ncbi:hypothetical protein B0O80DRAFT_448516, partial [Mortierella sp. GBAus27b]
MASYIVVCVSVFLDIGEGGIFGPADHKMNSLMISPPFLPTLILLTHSLYSCSINSYFPFTHYPFTPTYLTPTSNILQSKKHTSNMRNV